MTAQQLLTAEALLKERRVESSRLEFKTSYDDHTQRIPFDAQICADQSARDLNPDLVEDLLHRAQSGLAGPDTHLEDKLRGLGLLRRINGHEAPVHAALLFFTHEPQQRYRGATIELVQVADDGDTLHERTITGRLPWLIEEGLAALRALTPTLVHKHDRRAEADRSAAWPLPAIDEALVNAVHHRGYDPAYPDPIKVLLYPDRLEIISYPGPMPGITHETLQSGQVAHTSARNRHISELLKAAGLAEARGSGIGKIRRAMQRAGNPAPSFDFDEPARTFFKVTLPIHPDHLPSAQALPLRSHTPCLAGELVGREDLLQILRHELPQHSLALLGPPGRGLSSILNGLAAELPGYEAHRLTLAASHHSGLVDYLDRLLVDSGDAALALLIDEVAARGDPTGLRARVDQLRRISFDALQAAALDLVATGSFDTWDDLIRELSADTARIDAVPPLQRLLEDGWLVERGGHITFEHPYLLEAWQRRQRHLSELPF